TFAKIGSLRRGHLRKSIFLCFASIAFLVFSPINPVANTARSFGQNKLLLYRLAASNFVRLALKCVNKEVPNKTDHVINDANDLKSPKIQHPAFYGCYDWHSSVHGHWMLVRLLRTFPDLTEAAEIRRALDSNLTADNVRVETAYLAQPNRQSFERTYGWAWLLKLAEELDEWDDADAKRWSTNLRPLADA